MAAGERPEAAGGDRPMLFAGVIAGSAAVGLSFIAPARLNVAVGRAATMPYIQPHQAERRTRSASDNRGAK